MKELYESPELQIVRFTIKDSVLASSFTEPPTEEDHGHGGNPVTEPVPKDPNA